MQERYIDTKSGKAFYWIIEVAVQLISEINDAIEVSYED